jgi:two-component system OmpR family response regulator
VVIEAAGLRMDPAARTVHRGEHAIALSSREYALLECFMRHPGQVMTRAQLMASVWDFAFESDSNVVDVYVRYLREKIDRPFAVESIATVRGVGYRLREDAPG